MEKSEIFQKMKKIVDNEKIRNSQKMKKIIDDDEKQKIHRK